MIEQYVLGLDEVDEMQVAVVGGKGAHLGGLSRIDGIRVPPGFCVTTGAFRRIRAEAPFIDHRLDQLSRLNPDDREATRTLSAEIRRTLEEIAIPGDLAAAITGVLARLGEHAAYAVRSSATAEDLPTASFAGQQDTYLNVVGPAAILQHISRCWASLFTERAVTYRQRNGFDHRTVHMAVVVQRMVFPQAAGILFTADPVTSNRRVASVEAGFGLGEALVSGLVNGDVYKVRDGEVIAKSIGTKRFAIHASAAGGTQEQPIDPELQDQPVLTDAQVVRLVQLGRQIEAHFGRPQDIEWCLASGGFAELAERTSGTGSSARGTSGGVFAELAERTSGTGSSARGTSGGVFAELAERTSGTGSSARGTSGGVFAELAERTSGTGSSARGTSGGEFAIVQSRPITTLFPIPEPGDRENHVYVSVGHQQMMTDAMKPLGLSFWQMTTPAPMAEAGGRLFVDVTKRLASPASRAGILEALGRSDPLTGDALRTILERDGFIRPLPDEGPPGPLFGGAPAPIETDPAVVTELIGRTQDSIAAAERDIRTKSGEALLDFIQADIQELRRILFDPRSHQVFMSAMEAAWWLGDHLQEWLGEQNAADTLTQSVPHNVTSEMGLALLDVADVIRPHPDVVEFLRHVDGGGFLDRLAELSGGREARDAIEAWLAKYGMRCVGEIDITRPRWSERPWTLVPVILGNIKNFEPGAGAQRFEQGRQEAWTKEQDVLERLRALPDGDRKAEEAKRMIDRVRTFIGYREYPKYGMVSRYFVYRKALLQEAERLVQAHVLVERDDIFYLTFPELRDVVRTNHVDDRLIGGRKEAFRSYQALTPPRVLTSDGEVITGAYRRSDAPTGALVGLPVSAGVIEGRARVILDMAQADLEAGDILVTAYTDPSWTPLFVAIAGLVTEVGGLMTHGAVIAREYGLPAVVGVVDATRLIPDGRRIRVHGTAGYIEILP